MELVFKKYALFFVIAVLHFALPLQVTTIGEAFYGGMVSLAIMYMIFVTTEDAILFKKKEKILDILLYIILYVIVIAIFVYFLHIK